MLNSELLKQKDKDLIKAYLKGQVEAFEVLFERYQSLVMFLTHQYFPQKEKAEEVFQEIFMKLIEKIKKFEHQGSFKAWFLTLARNHCIDRVRYYQRRPESTEAALSKEENAQASFIEKHAVTQATAEKESARSQTAEHLQQALNELPPEQKETLLLKESQGLTFEEIGRVMQVSTNTAKSRLRYALQALRKSLKLKAFFKELKT